MNNLQPIEAFFKEYEITLTPGTIDSIRDNQGQHKIEDLICNTIPGKIIKLPYDQTNLSILPSPLLLICKDQKLVLCQKTYRKQIIISKDGSISHHPIEKQTFENQYKPEWVIIPLVNHDFFSWRRYFFSFIKSRPKILISGVIGGLLSNLAGLALPIAALLIIDKVLRQNGVSTLDAIIVFVIIAEVFRYLMTLSKNIIINEIGDDFIHEISALVAKITLSSKADKPHNHHDQLFKINKQLKELKPLISKQLTTIVADGLFVILLFLLMLSLNQLLAIISIFGVFINLAVSVLLSKISGIIYARNFRLENSLWSFSDSTTRYATDYKYMGLESGLWHEIKYRLDSLTAEKQRQIATMLNIFPVNTLVLGLVRVSILWTGALLVLEGVLTLGQFVAFSLMSALMLSPVKNLSELVQNIPKYGKILSDIKLFFQIDDQLETAKKTKLLPPLQLGDISLVDLELEMDRLNKSGRRLDLEIEAGTSVAIMGESGTGKSSLLRAIGAINSISKGEILYGNRDISEYSDTAYRQLFGILRQSPEIIAGSVFDIVTMKQEGITQQTVMNYLDAVDLKDRVSMLKNGLEHIISQDNTQMSAGEFQRLCLARALIQKKNIFLLDEPTSSVDPSLEKKLVDEIMKITSGCTLIAVTHSEAFASEFDKIYTLTGDGLYEHKITKKDIISK